MKLTGPRKLLFLKKKKKIMFINVLFVDLRIEVLIIQVFGNEYLLLMYLLGKPLRRLLKKVTALNSTGGYIGLTTIKA